MCDAAFVRSRESGDNLLGVLNRLARRHRSFVQALAQFLPFEKFTDDVRRAFVIPDVKDGENVWMIERGSGARFLLKAAQPVGIFGEVSGQDFDCHFADSRASRAR